MFSSSWGELRSSQDPSAGMTVWEEGRDPPAGVKEAGGRESKEEEGFLTPKDEGFGMTGGRR